MELEGAEIIKGIIHLRVQEKKIWYRLRLFNQILRAGYGGTHLNPSTQEVEASQGYIVGLRKASAT
jgi:hypothetical protein